MSVLITLTTAGTNTGPFNIYSNTDGYTTAFATGITRAQLLAGYLAITIPQYTSTVLVKSTGACARNLYLDVSGAPTSTTTTTSSTSTTTSTTTISPIPLSKLTNYGSRSINVALKKNNDVITTFGVGSVGAFYNFSLGGITWGPTDKLTLLVGSTSPYGANLNVDNASIYPNGGAMPIPASNYNGEGTNTVEIIFNNLGGGWGVNPMTSFNITLTAY